MTSNAPASPAAIDAISAQPRRKPSNYPAVFAARMAGRIKRQLGDVFGLKNFGVNLTELAPRTSSSIHHRHTRQDEFIYVLEGRPTLYRGDERIELRPGSCAGFPADGDAHHLVNEGTETVRILEIGDRTRGDAVSYPHDDLATVLTEGGWRFEHKDGTPYED